MFFTLLDLASTHAILAWVLSFVYVTNQYRVIGWCINYEINCRNSQKNPFKVTMDDRITCWSGLLSIKPADLTSVAVRH